MADRLPIDRLRNLPPPQQDLAQGFIPADLIYRRHVNYKPPTPARQPKRQHFDPFR